MNHYCVSASEKDQRDKRKATYTTRRVSNFEIYYRFVNMERIENVKLNGKCMHCTEIIIITAAYRKQPPTLFATYI